MWIDILPGLLESIAISTILNRTLYWVLSNNYLHERVTKAYPYCSATIILALLDFQLSLGFLLDSL
jgi:hypothetical protein